MGVWIETRTVSLLRGEQDVTPYVGVWIETYGGSQYITLFSSLLMWECGLKLFQRKNLRKGLGDAGCGGVDLVGGG